MKIITRYLYKAILFYFAVFLAMVTVVLIVSLLFDARSLIVDNATHLEVVVEFLLFSIPLQLAQVAPMIALMATIFAFGLLAKNREILAMVAAGISFRALALPALTFGIVLSAGLFLFNEYVVPESQTQAVTIEKIVMGGKNESIFTKRDDLFVKGSGNRFYLMQEFRSDKGEMVWPTILVTSDGGGRLTDRIEAAMGRLKGDYWEFEGAEHWTFNDDGTVRTYERYQGPYREKMEDKLDKFLSKTKKPEEMNYAELREYRNLLLNKGGQDAQRYTLDLQHKLSFPLACLLMAALGFAVVADVHARHFARGVLTGLLVAVVYYVFDSLMRHLGSDGTVPWLPAGWGPTAIFALVVYYLLRRLESIRY